MAVLEPVAEASVRWLGSWSSIPVMAGRGKKFLLKDFAKPLSSGLKKTDARRRQRAELPPATVVQVRARLKVLEEAREQADAKSRETHLGHPAP
jgi:hypothetical protein